MPNTARKLQDRYTYGDYRHWPDTKYGCRGAPDWIIKVLSPSTSLRDQRTKRDLYQQHGVKEYWIVHPTDRIVTVYVLENGRYGLPQIYGMDEPTASVLFPDLLIGWSGIE